MRFLPTELPEVRIVELDVFRDERGFFAETHRVDRFAAGGIEATFVQDNHSGSVRGVLRGLHAQDRSPQGKLVRVLRGEIFDVAVDIRRGSPTFRRWVGVPLVDREFRALWIPEGFAHGFQVTSEFAEIEYKCTALYDPEGQIGIAWNDPEIGIRWPVESPILSPRDADAPRLAEIADRLPRHGAEARAS